MKAPNMLIFFLTTLFATLIPLNDFGMTSDVFFKNKPFRIQCKVAKTSYQQQRGLMYRKNLADYKGMLFVYDNEEILTFWMKNTYIPLNILYIKEDLSIDSTHYMKPLNDKLIYSSKKPSKYALEITPATFDKLMVGENDSAILEFKLFYNLLGQPINELDWVFHE